MSDLDAGCHLEEEMTVKVNLERHTMELSQLEQERERLSKLLIEARVEIVKLRVGIKEHIEELVTGDFFDKVYDTYQDELEGLALMAPSTCFGPKGIKGAYKEAARRMVFEMIKEYSERQITGGEK